MPTKVLLSIKPQFAAKIFDGTKRYEFRRKVFRDRTVNYVVVYASAPVGKVIGEFQVQDILELQKELLWDRTNKGAGITKGYFDQYFEGRDIGFAIEVKSAKLYENPLGLDEAFQISHPPQSFMYL